MSMCFAKLRFIRTSGLHQDISRLHLLHMTYLSAQTPTFNTAPLGAHWSIQGNQIGHRNIQGKSLSIDIKEIIRLVYERWGMSYAVDALIHFVNMYIDIA